LGTTVTNENSIHEELRSEHYVFTLRLWVTISFIHWFVWAWNLVCHVKWRIL